MSSNNNQRTRTRRPPGLSAIPTNHHATTIPDNAVLTDRQEPPQIPYTIIRTLEANSPPPGININVRKWSHVLFGHPTTGGLFHATIPTDLSFFEAFRERGILITDYKVCNQLIRHVHHNLLFPFYDPTTMSLTYTGDFTNVHFHWQDILGERAFVTGSDAAMRRLGNEIAVAEVMHHPLYRELCLHANLARYLGVCVDSFQRVNCTAWTSSMATLRDFALAENLLAENLVMPILKRVEKGMRQMHSLGISHGAINEMNVSLSWEPFALQKRLGARGDGTHAPSVRITQVVLGNFDRAVDHAANGVVEEDIESAMRADEMQLVELQEWMNSNMRASEPSRP
ncbi:hypothetical protein BDU57DRAFT_193553 [Ampelomyces quisqualis]|uniref:Protein kinase domain-containing protein n=1 Tax=Ampelomyces quisqualis TaxID=50730 RepID=A0A6A5QUP0_AMPQU|nr:hypothetical protein BDU57DRAFT_193553 [Ampelomyces quisqualis]